MKKIVIFLTCLVFLAPVVRAAWWSGNTADNNISYDSAPNNLSSRFPRITAGPEGNLYCIWRQGPSSGAGELYFGKSTDNGTTWSSYTSDVMISANDGQNVGGFSGHTFAITTNSLGDIFIVWAEDLVANDEVMLLKSTDYGVTWIHGNADFNVSYAGSTVNAYDPEIAIDYNDNIYVVWHQDIPAADSSEIHISISTDNGVTWSGTTADRYISFYDACDANGADIAITPNNDIYVAWREKNVPTNADTYTLMYGKSTDGGATFNSGSADNPISVNVRSSYAPKLVADTLGNVHASWKGYSSVSSIPAELFYTGSTDGGATWSGNSGMRIVDFGAEDGVHVHNPSFGVTPAGKLIAVWNETIPPYTHAVIFASYSHDGGLTWTGNDEPEILDFPDGRGAYNPDVFAGVGDTLYVVWNESLTPSGSNYYDILISKGDTLAPTVVAPIGRCCYDDTLCADNTEAECLALAGTWDADSNCVDNPCPSAGCDYVVGDVNGSNSYNGLDITYGVAFFKGGPDPLCEFCALCPDWHYCGDVNGSCSYNGLDITYGVAYFKGGALPIPCADCPPIG